MVGFPTHLGARQSQAQPITMSFPPQKGFITDKKKKKKKLQCRCLSGWSPMSLQVKLDVKVLGWYSYSWSAVVRPVRQCPVL